MNNLRLVFPALEHKLLWHSFKDELIQNGGRINPGIIMSGDGTYESFLQVIIDHQNDVNIPEQYVQSTTYFLMDEHADKILGAISIRHRLNEYLLQIGGHIGYGIAPSERRKGYGTKMLSLALDKCRELGLEKVLITCDKDNIGSAKVMQNNGGVLENEIVKEDGVVVQRYWICL